MQGWTRQARRDIFLLHLLEMGPLATNLVHYQDEQSAARSESFNICLYDITASLYFILSVDSVLPLSVAQQR